MHAATGSQGAQLTIPDNVALNNEIRALDGNMSGVPALLRDKELDLLLDEQRNYDLENEVARGRAVSQQINQMGMASSQASLSGGDVTNSAASAAPQSAQNGGTSTSVRGPSRKGTTAQCSRDWHEYGGYFEGRNYFPLFSINFQLRATSKAFKGSSSPDSCLREWRYIPRIEQTGIIYGFMNKKTQAKANEAYLSMSWPASAKGILVTSIQGPFDADTGHRFFETYGTYTYSRNYRIF